MIMIEKNWKGLSLLNEVLERRMLLYALAAGAALAGASPVHAKVIFTPSDAVLRGDNRNVSLQIDLNNDGVVDFILYEKFLSISSTYFYLLYTRGAPGGNAIWTTPRKFQAPLEKGAMIGGNAPFSNSGAMDEFGDGPWGNVTKRYLGVKFAINGQVHYGWIGFRRVERKTYGVGAITAKLGGWAYESDPDQAIKAGDTGEGDPGASHPGSSALFSAEPTSLQLLAMGHTGIANRQRRLAAQARS
jgi:hypothetical protein